jgi:hypothetical protein
VGDLIKKIYTFDWEREHATKTVKINRNRNQNEETLRYYAWRHFLEYEVAKMTGRFEVEVDVDAIIQHVVAAAAHAKSGKSEQFHGYIKAKAITRTVISKRTRTNPIPEGCIEIPETEKGGKS